MWVAIFLLLAVVVDCLLTVWCLARLRGYVEQMSMVRRVVENQGRMLVDVSNDGNGQLQDIEVPEVDTDTAAAAASLLSEASPEDLAKAASILEKLGL